MQEKVPTYIRFFSLNASLGNDLLEFPLYIPNMMSFAPCTHETSNVSNRYRDTCIVIQVLQITALQFWEINFLRFLLHIRMPIEKFALLLWTEQATSI